MATDQAVHYRMDDEQRARVRDCLAKDKRSLSRDRLARFVGGIETSIAHFLAAVPESGFRDAHDGLRKLWELSHDDDPPVGVIRARIAALPEQAIAYIDRRAQIVISRLFPAEAPTTGFREWAAIADEAKLIRATQVLSAEGARLVEGRSCGGGKRSAISLEPVIMGEARGIGAVRHRGGRPTNAGHQNLVMHLAMDWLVATGEPPTPGRSEAAGFGDLIHSVFQWLSLPAGSAPHTLRQYWTNIGKG